jgi:predicted TIM-barrel fold metal-dependent hydrolase
MWGERVDRKFRDRAPHTQKGYDGTEGEFFVCENIRPVQVAGFFGSGKTAEELPEHRKRGFEVAPKSVWDPAERLKEQDRDGVDAEALYTSMGMLLFGLDDAELRSACFRGFNDWAAEYCSYNPKRLIGLGTVDLSDIPVAVKELERCRKMGIRGVLIWGSPPEDKPYGHLDYDPFWAAAQELDMPVSLHILTGRRGTGADPTHVLRSYLGLPHSIQMSFGELVLGGVLERENDISWLPHFCYRLDHAYDRLRHLDTVKLALRPSDYLKRQVFATFQWETENVGFTAEKYGGDKLMWSSDYPHTDSPWPRSREFIESWTGKLEQADREKITGGNVADLYHVN